MAKKPLELQSLKWPFVGLSVLLALSTFWAVYDEVIARRPWKEFQRDFFKLEERHIQADLVRASKRLEEPATKQQLDAALAELAQAQAAMAGSPEQRRGFDEARSAEEKARQDEEEAKLYLGFEKSEADAVYYELREARHEGKSEGRSGEPAYQKKLDDIQHRIDEKAKRYAEAQERYAKAKEARLAFQKRVDEAQVKVDALQKPVEEARKRLTAYRGFPGKLPEMEQYWIAGLPNSWGAPTVDRCQNCHMAIDKAGFSAPAEVLEAKKLVGQPGGLTAADFKAQFATDDEVVEAYQKVHDKLCEEIAQPLAAIPIGGNPAPSEPSPVDAAAATECRSGAVYQKWSAMSEAYCGRAQRWLLKTRFLLKDEKGAPIAEGKGRGPRVQDGESAEHGHAGPAVAQACADKDTVAAFEEAEKGDLFDVRPAFRTHPHRFELIVKNHQAEKFGCTTCHGGQGPQTKGVMHRAFRHGADDHDWNDPLTEEVHVLGRTYPGAFMQSKCDKCHQQELTLSYAPLLSRGKKLFTDVGCWGCHPIDGYNELPRRGPTLLSIASKTSPGWLTTWIQQPRAFRPATRMPNFWPGAVDASAVPRAQGESDAEVLARHQKLRSDEVAQISAYLWVSSTPAALRTPPAGSADKGKELFESLGCQACHVIEKGAATRRSEGSDSRDYAPNLWNIADKTNASWIFTWIKNPKALWPETKMPDLRLSDEEAADLTAFLLTKKSGESYPEPAGYAEGKLAELEKLAPGGKTLIAKYGCFGCHNIKGFETAQKIGTELTEHGRKDSLLLDFGDVRWFTEDPKHRQTYANWVWTKLHTPRIYAYERVETRMPQFDFSDDEALALLVFLKGQTGEKVPREWLAGQDPQKQSVLAGERMVFWNGCRQCHTVEKRGGAIRDRFNEDNQSYAPPVLTGEGAKVQPAWLFSFLKGPYPLRPWLQVRMPTFHFSDDDATSVVRYFAAASGKSFPYLSVDTPAPTGDRARETLELFAALQCTKCHVVGKLAPNQDPGSAAPNFLLAKSRLRPDWIPLWLRNPNALLEGTRMPAFWDMDPSADPPHKAFAGNKQAQMEALRDLLMHLGEPGLDPSATGRKSASVAEPGPHG